MDLGKWLLSNGCPYLLTDKFNQDPLEEEFGKHRRKGGANDNPTYDDFGRDFNGLNVAGDKLIKIYGNSKGRQRDDIRLDIHDTRPLPKKARK